MAPEDNNVSCLNSRAIIDYIRRRDLRRVPDLFQGLPAPWADMTNLEDYLCDENNWIPSSLVVALFERARSITGNPEVAFDIGFQSIVHREFSYWQKIFLKIFNSPRMILRRMNQLNQKLNSTKIVELISNTPNRALIRWHWREGVISSKDVCSYNKGIYSAIPTIWGRPAASVKEHACQFEGKPFCEITFGWTFTLGRFMSVFSRADERESPLSTALEEIERDKNLLRERFNSLETLNRELTNANQELLQNVTMLKAINNATRTLVSVADTKEVLRQTMTPIVEVFGFDRAMIMLVDKSGDFLEYIDGVGESPQAMSKMLGYRIPLNREKNLMVRVLKEKRPILIPDVQSAGLNPANKILADFRPSAFIVCPLVAEGKVLGILGVDRRGDDTHLSDNDTEALSIFANNIATAYQRARLEEEKKSSYESAILALALAIDKKDPYTHGHSERVAAMAVALARELGLPESEMEYIRFGSILHDVGKIGIPESIVRKTKPLNDAEYRIIRRHPEKGQDILQPIALLKNHMHLIRSHHERWDGKGYPDGLAGDEIPVGAQIVSVVDAFDAMTSSRPYRKGMSRVLATAEIRRNMGVQFSGRVAEAFLAINESFAISEETTDITKK